MCLPHHAHVPRHKMSRFATSYSAIGVFDHYSRRPYCSRPRRRTSDAIPHVELGSHRSGRGPSSLALLSRPPPCIVYRSPSSGRETLQSSTGYSAVLDAVGR